MFSQPPTRPAATWLPFQLHFNGLDLSATASLHTNPQRPRKLNTSELTRKSFLQLKKKNRTWLKKKVEEKTPLVFFWTNHFLTISSKPSKCERLRRPPILRLKSVEVGFLLETKKKLETFFADFGTKGWEDRIGDWKPEWSFLHFFRFKVRDNDLGPDCVLNNFVSGCPQANALKVLQTGHY